MKQRRGAGLAISCCWLSKDLSAELYARADWPHPVLRNNAMAGV